MRSTQLINAIIQHLIVAGKFIHLQDLTIGPHYMFGYAITDFRGNVIAKSSKPDFVADYLLMDIDNWYSRSELYWAIRDSNAKA